MNRNTPKTCRYVKYQLLLAQRTLRLKNGTGVQYTAENVHKHLLEELCNIKYGPAAVTELRLKYTELANQFNKADLAKLAKGRLITDKNLSFYHTFCDNNTKTSQLASDIIDLVDSSNDSDICSSTNIFASQFIKR